MDHWPTVRRLGPRGVSANQLHSLWRVLHVRDTGLSPLVSKTTEGLTHSDEGGSVLGKRKAVVTERLEQRKLKPTSLNRDAAKK